MCVYTQIYIVHGSCCSLVLVVQPAVYTLNLFMSLSRAFQESGRHFKDYTNQRDSDGGKWDAERVKGCVCAENVPVVCTVRPWNAVKFTVIDCCVNRVKQIQLDWSQMEEWVLKSSFFEQELKYLKDGDPSRELFICFYHLVVKLRSREKETRVPASFQLSEQRCIDWSRRTGRVGVFIPCPSPQGGQLTAAPGTW